MINYFKTVNNCVTIESYILNYSKSYLERSFCKIILSSLSERWNKNLLKFEFRSHVFDDVRNKLVSAHCIVMSTVDENHKNCLF